MESHMWVVAGRLSRAEHPPPPPLPRHTATEKLPEIFNSAAAVNSPATLEINVMRVEERGSGRRERAIDDGWEDGQMSSGGEKEVWTTGINGAAAGERWR
ncbi:hypothetical protein EYF80_023092 [Liparis tanakae]|uniref:Uncharacterized protein n=1 Tax=Liparis tanakae TaxID=230148 RepID=A0A4Z2HNY5_9TELE|nr:hypothetical protein EYF80_023092 [Liparis tanakae]